jgi:hypothetical protein
MQERWSVHACMLACLLANGTQPTRLIACDCNDIVRNVAQVLHESMRVEKFYPVFDLGLYRRTQDPYVAVAREHCTS